MKKPLKEATLQKHIKVLGELQALTDRTHSQPWEKISKFFDQWQVARPLRGVIRDELLTENPPGKGTWYWNPKNREYSLKDLTIYLFGVQTDRQLEGAARKKALAKADMVHVDKLPEDKKVPELNPIEWIDKQMTDASLPQMNPSPAREVPLLSHAWMDKAMDKTRAAATTEQEQSLAHYVKTEKTEWLPKAKAAVAVDQAYSVVREDFVKRHEAAIAVCEKAYEAVKTLRQALLTAEQAMQEADQKQEQLAGFIALLEEKGGAR